MEPVVTKTMPALIDYSPSSLRFAMEQLHFGSPSNGDYTTGEAGKSLNDALRHVIQGLHEDTTKSTKKIRNAWGDVEDDTWSEEKEEIMLAPYHYIASKRGKEFRTMLIKAFNDWLDLPLQSLTTITNVVRLLHTASLLIDDIEDNSALRRGQPAAHKIYGVAQTINSGNYVYFLALKELNKLKNPAAAIDIYTTEMLHLHRGQGMDLFWRDSFSCPKEEDYLEMVSNKTGGLFRLAVRLMQLESPTSIDCIPLATLLGLIFQIGDDYNNLANLDYTQQKGLCEDLTEGKFSFPVIHSIKANPSDRTLLYILSQRPTDVEVKKAAVEYIQSTGSLDYTKGVVDKLIVRAKEVVNQIDQGLGKNKGIYMLLDKLALN